MAGGSHTIGVTKLRSGGGPVLVQQPAETVNSLDFAPTFEMMQRQVGDVLDGDGGGACGPLSPALSRPCLAHSPTMDGSPSGGSPALRAGQADDLAVEALGAEWPC